jgi:hypothetical protein
MRTGAIHFAQRFIEDRTGLILKKYADFRQHREASDEIAPMKTIQHKVLTRH